MSLRDFFDDSFIASNLLGKEFYHQEIHTLARDLLGRDLVRRLPNGHLVGRIVEVEVYGGVDDPASHARSGTPSRRNWPMFGNPGLAYVYKIYGMYHCLNVVALPSDVAGAILIRACEPVQGLDIMAKNRALHGRYGDVMPRIVQRNLLSGPGKICQAMNIDLSHNGAHLDQADLCLTRGAPIATDSPDRVVTTPRVGLNPDTIGVEPATRPWRYIIKDSPFTSR